MAVGLRRRKALDTDAQQAAIRSWSGAIPLGEPRAELPADERVARLIERYRELQRGGSLFQRDFTAFATHLCWTKDEAAGGIVRRMPDYPYLREFDTRLITESRLLVEKSRRVLASWRMCCFDIWIAAGGQDRRWLALMNSTGNRRIILAARKLEDEAGSAWFLSERVKFILDQFEERDLRRFWPDFPTWKYRFGAIEWSNGSVIAAIPQGADQIRGPGATLLHFEELAFWEQAGPSVNAAVPSLKGGGHLAGITTPKANSYAHKVVKGGLRRGAAASTRETSLPNQVLPFRVTPDGWGVLTVHWSVVPGFDFDAAVEGMDDDTIRREMEIDWTATSGVRVYQDFNQEYHVAKSPLPFNPNETLYCGFDFGLCPAFVVMQINSYGQLCILSALAPEEGSGIGTYEFGEMVADHLIQRYCLPYAIPFERLKLKAFGDPAGANPETETARTKLQQDVRSHFDILRDGVYVLVGHDRRGEPEYEHRPGWGWHIIPGEKHIAKRMEALRARLKLLVNGRPAVSVCPTCTEARDALATYHYKIRADGRQELDPEKDWASHLTNAIEYAVTRLYHKHEDEDEDVTPLPRIVSMAAHPDWRQGGLGR